LRTARPVAARAVRSGRARYQGEEGAVHRRFNGAENDINHAVCVQAPKLCNRGQGLVELIGDRHGANPFDVLPLDVDSVEVMRLSMRRCKEMANERGRVPASEETRRITVSVRLLPAIKEALERAAVADRRTLANLAEILIEDGLKARGLIGE
jgi:hypothetical protein